MAKKAHDNHSPSSTATVREKPKKQTKKDAKVQLAIEQVQASLAKTQSKLEKLQARVEEQSSLLHKLETKLATKNSSSPAEDTHVTKSSSNHQHQPEAKTSNTGAPVMSSPIAKHDVPHTYEESQTVSDPSKQQAEDRHDAALDDATEIENVTKSQESNERPFSNHETSAQESASGMRPQKRVSMNNLTGLEPGVKTKLESEGITNTQLFLEQTRTLQQRTELASKVDSTPVIILEWANRADLMRLRGVGGVFSNMLEEAGIHSCRELQQSEPEQLYTTLETINTDKNIGHHLPTQVQVTEWIAEAKTLAETSPE